jgi:hypothetical protein
MTSASMDPPPVGRDCLNCDEPLSGPYCSQCGQRDPQPDPMLRELVQETVTELTSWDGKVLATMKTLMARPGRLTVDFLAGRRARWLSPLRLYLICSIAFFLLSPVLDALAEWGSRSGGTTAAETEQERAAAADETEPRSLSWADRLFRRIAGKERLERLDRESDAFQRFFDESIPKAMLLLLPVLALLVQVAYRRSALRYPRHLYFALHVHAAAFVTLLAAAVVRLIPADVISRNVKLVALAFIVWYTVRAMRMVYGGSRAATVAKALLIGALYAICFAVVVVATAIVSVMLF